jgi:hypothetical protein
VVRNNSSLGKLPTKINYILKSLNKILTIIWMMINSARKNHNIRIDQAVKINLTNHISQISHINQINQTARPRSRHLKRVKPLKITNRRKKNRNKLIKNNSKFQKSNNRFQRINNKFQRSHNNRPTRSNPKNVHNPQNRRIPPNPTGLPNPKALQNPMVPPNTPLLNPQNPTKSIDNKTNLFISYSLKILINFGFGGNSDPLAEADPEYIVEPAATVLAVLAVRNGGVFHLHV